MVVQQPGAPFTYGTVKAGEFVLDYAEARPDAPTETLVSFPGSAGLEMSPSKDILAERYRVIEINPPGWGGKDDLNRPMPMAETAQLLAEAANQLVQDRYYILGSSMGGVNAVYAAAAHPERVKGIILEGGMAPAREQDVIVPPPPRPEPDAPVQAPFQSEGAPQYPQPPVNPKKPWATDEFIANQMANRFKMIAWVAPEFLPEDALKSLTDLRLPVLALLGDQDEILRPSQREAFATYLPHADFRFVAGGMHDLQNINVAEFVALVEEFLNR
ncbi:alpha/beta fold hydrolase [Angustibacter luteus]|uniref:Alpha/beta fold hydrolase n=1 Tax=Angustibacter luteus TaxID=658456 RepID=A0ABW1JEZ2_9ACTN